jgi:hypothetical protein
MPLAPVTLEGRGVRLEPLGLQPRDALLAAAADGQLWELKVTVVPSAATIDAYFAEAEAGSLAYPSKSIFRSVRRSRVPSY